MARGIEQQSFEDQARLDPRDRAEYRSEVSGIACKLVNSFRARRFSAEMLQSERVQRLRERNDMARGKRLRHVMSAEHREDGHAGRDMFWNRTSPARLTSPTASDLAPDIPIDADLFADSDWGEEGRTSSSSGASTREPSLTSVRSSSSAG